LLFSIIFLYLLNTQLRTDHNVLEFSLEFNLGRSPCCAMGFRWDGSLSIIFREKFCI